MPEENPNTGHGHVRKRPDGQKARCGGPAMCSECALEAARLNLPHVTNSGTPYTIATVDIVPSDIDIEALSARLHDVYQNEAHRRGDVRHPDDYADLSEDTKEWDRVLARWIVNNWRPMFEPRAGMPPV